MGGKMRIIGIFVLLALCMSDQFPAVDAVKCYVCHSKRDGAECKSSEKSKLDKFSIDCSQKDANQKSVFLTKVYGDDMVNSTGVVGIKAFASTNSNSTDLGWFSVNAAALKNLTDLIPAVINSKETLGPLEQSNPRDQPAVDNGFNVCRKIKTETPSGPDIRGRNGQNYWIYQKQRNHTEHIVRFCGRRGMTYDYQDEKWVDQAMSCKEYNLPAGTGGEKGHSTICTCMGDECNKSPIMKGTSYTVLIMAAVILKVIYI